MSFVTPLKLQLINDRGLFPFITLEPLVYECDLTGETYTVPKHFMTDGASIPIALSALPVIGSMLAIRYFGGGIWLGFKEGVLHDYLRRERNGNTPVKASVAHRIFRAALYEAGYEPDMCETYYAAVKAFNS